MFDDAQSAALAAITRHTAALLSAEQARSRDVARAVHHGATWAQIGTALGVTSQSAHRRYRHHVYDPATGMTWSEPPLPLG